MSARTHEPIRNAITRLIMTILALILPLAATAADQPPYGATVAPFKTPPTIDGKLAEGEWDGALRLPAVMNFQNETITPHGCQVYFGYTPEHLYFAIVSELPPDGKLLAKETRRGADPQALVFDDGIEIYIDPNRANRVANRGVKDFFNYQGNSVGAYTTVKYGAEGAPDRNWDGGWEVANGLHREAGIWVQELRVPIAGLGLKPADLANRDLGILVARNVKRGTGWIQAVWFPHKGAFVGVDNYPVIRLSPNAPTVSLDSLGGLDLHKGPLKLDARIFNPGPARKVVANLFIESTDMPELSQKQELDLPAGGVATYRYQVSEGRLHEDAKHALRLKIASVDGAETFFNYHTRWTKAPANRWPQVRLGPQPDQALTLTFYPTYNYLRLDLVPECA